MNAMLHEASPVDVAPLLARGLTHCYEGSNVLRGVDLALEPGSVLGLIGRNGAGKSTLIRAMLGLLEPLSGAAFVFGEPALKLSDAVKARLAYVPQQPEALAWLTAQQMLDYVGRFYPRWDAGFARGTLERWKIQPNKLLAKLSPGERQRVDLIRALASQPELLVLDEPAAALDPVARRELLREVALRAGEAAPRCCSPATSCRIWSASLRRSRFCMKVACCFTVAWMTPRSATPACGCPRRSAMRRLRRH
ncbi:ABC transporter ATP-binding protein YtrB [Rhodanobacter lindaniclasticus]